MDGIEKSLKKKEEKMNTGGEVREGGGVKGGTPSERQKSVTEIGVQVAF